MAGVGVRWIAVGCVPLIFSCASDRRPSDGTPASEGTVLVTSAGATLSVGQLAVEFPPGAVERPIQVSARQMADSSGPSQGPTFDLGPSGTAFRASARPRMSIALAPPNCGTAHMRLTTLANGSWETIAGSRLEHQAHGDGCRVVGDIPHFSVFGVAPSTCDGVAESQSARDLVEDLQSRFIARASGTPSNTPAHPVIGASLVECVQRDGPWLDPQLITDAMKGVRRRGVVQLPQQALGAFRISDPAADGLWVQVAFADARDVPAEVGDGFIVYRSALGAGADIVHRVTAEGTEDFIAYATAPPGHSLAYEIELGPSVAGLRLVERVLEVLDATGSPRLRMSPPRFFEEDGTEHMVAVTTQGCSVDRDPRAPWGRRTAKPSTSHCGVRLHWADAHPTYPLLVDPSWTATGNMVAARTLFTATRLSNGLVLAAGGQSVLAPRAELFSPSAGSWAATGPMVLPRQEHAAAELADGTVLVAGGDYSGAAALDPTLSAETYSPTTGTWTRTGPMQNPRRAGFVLARTGAAGGVLAAGGYYSQNPDYQAGEVYDNSAERYDPTTRNWSTTQAMGQRRAYFAGTRLSDGRVFVAGGAVGPDYAFLIRSTAEIYDPGFETWSSAGTMAVSRDYHTVTLIPGLTPSADTVLVAGGYDGAVHATAELFSVASATWSVASMVFEHMEHAAVALPRGDVLIVGGQSNLAGYTSTAEVFNATTRTFAPATPMPTELKNHTATLLGDGSVLVAGGNSPISAVSTADLYSPEGNGTACGAAADCRSGFCVDGVCCDAACGGGALGDCLACSLAAGGVSDGTCAALTNGSACTFANGSATCQAGSCQSTGCNAGFADCDHLPANGCEADLGTDGYNCGACDIPCGTTRVCYSGTCCLQRGWLADCDGIPSNCYETNTDEDMVNCGACGNLCHGTASRLPACVGGICATNPCAPGTLNCDLDDTNGCEKSFDAQNCGGCGVACSGNHVSAPSCVNGACTGTCDVGWADCNVNLKVDGCETDLSTDVNHCGSCAGACGLPNSTCNSGICCYPSYLRGDCDGILTNCFETDLANNIDNCGACGNVCPGTTHSLATCSSNGICSTTACGVYALNCDLANANGCETPSDAQNCGDCGIVCSSNHIAAAICNSGNVCEGACDPDWTDCNLNKQLDGCETLLVDACGPCGVPTSVCSSNHVNRHCTVGVCDGACQPGWGNCNGDLRADGCETSLLTDAANCGSCSHQCNTLNTDAVACVAGHCTGTCKAGFADCNGDMDTDGCEAIITADPNGCISVMDAPTVTRLHVRRLCRSARGLMRGGRSGPRESQFERA